MTTIKTWNIFQCGWATYFAEVVALTRGRADLQIVARQPGVLSLVVKE
jgi:hypothetical protein